MFYPAIKFAVKLSLTIFCRKINIGNVDHFKNKGPLLITANHPNSFLDAIIIGVHFKQPVHFLARGDAFNSPFAKYIFGLLNMIPVYRLSEGKENLSLNEETFKRSKEILNNNGIVLIFIEGISLHKHELQPFKKGASRIAKDSIDKEGLQVMPLGIAYDSFEKFGKTINMVAGSPIPVKELLPFDEEAKNMRYFNEKIFAELIKNIHVPERIPATKKTDQFLYFLPGLLGYLLHAPLYFILKTIIQKKTRVTVFFDSVLLGALLIIYPLYLLLWLLLLILFSANPLTIIIVLLIHPLLAWVAVRWRAASRRYAIVVKHAKIMIAS